MSGLLTGTASFTASLTSRCPVEARLQGKHKDQLLSTAPVHRLTEPEARRVHQSGSKGPLLVFFRGGGYTSLSWAACVASLDVSKYA